MIIARFQRLLLHEVVCVVFACSNIETALIDFAVWLFFAGAGFSVVFSVVFRYHLFTFS